jgi:hypothetical protein
MLDSGSAMQHRASTQERDRRQYNSSIHTSSDTRAWEARRGPVECRSTSYGRTRSPRSDRASEGELRFSRETVTNSGRVNPRGYARERQERAMVDPHPHHRRKVVEDYEETTYEDVGRAGVVQDSPLDDLEMRARVSNQNFGSTRSPGQGPTTHVAIPTTSTESSSESRWRSTNQEMVRRPR